VAELLGLRDAFLDFADAGDMVDLGLSLPRFFWSWLASSRTKSRIERCCSWRRADCGAFAVFLSEETFKDHARIRFGRDGQVWDFREVVLVRRNNQVTVAALADRIAGELGRQETRECPT
jgi:uncharacterized protein YfaT (DUF1175 family)